MIFKDLSNQIEEESFQSLFNNEKLFPDIKEMVEFDKTGFSFHSLFYIYEINDSYPILHIHIHTYSIEFGFDMHLLHKTIIDKFKTLHFDEIVLICLINFIRKYVGENSENKIDKNFAEVLFDYIVNNFGKKK